MWVEFNNRVNYPVKDALVRIVEQQMIQLDDPVTKFAVSWVTMRVCQVGIAAAVGAWNQHRIPSTQRITFNYVLIYLLL